MKFLFTYTLCVVLFAQSAQSQTEFGLEAKDSRSSAEGAAGLPDYRVLVFQVVDDGTRIVSVANGAIIKFGDRPRRSLLSARHVFFHFDGTRKPGTFYYFAPSRFMSLGLSSSDFSLEDERYMHEVGRYPDSVSPFDVSGDWLYVPMFGDDRAAFEDAILFDRPPGRLPNDMLSGDLLLQGYVFSERSIAPFIQRDVAIERGEPPIVVISNVEARPSLSGSVLVKEGEEDVAVAVVSHAEGGDCEAAGDCKALMTLVEMRVEAGAKVVTAEEIGLFTKSTEEEESDN